MNLHNSLVSEIAKMLIEVTCFGRCMSDRELAHAVFDAVSCVVVHVICYVIYVDDMMNILLLDSLSNSYARICYF